MVKEFTAYVRIPAKYCSGLRVEFDPDPEPLILTSGRTDPDKVYQIVSLEKDFGTWSVGDRFTGINTELSGKGTVFEVTAAFVFKRKDFPGKVVATLSGGAKIVHVHFKRHFIKAIKRLSNSESLDNNALAAAKLVNAYIGKTRQQVLNKYPELDGVDAEEIPHIEYHAWSGIN